MNILTRKIRTFDIGFEAEKDKAGAKVTYFHNKIDDPISSQYQGRFGRTVRYQYINIDKAAMKGLESEVTYRFDDHWHAKLSMTYLDAKNKLTQAPYRQCPHERSRRTFLYDGQG